MVSCIARFIGSLFGCLPSLVHPVVSEGSSETNQHPASSRQGMDRSSVEAQGIRHFIGVDASAQASSLLALGQCLYPYTRISLVTSINSD